MSREPLERLGQRVAELQDEALAEREDLGEVRSRLLRPRDRSRPRWGWPAFGLGLAGAAALVLLLLRPEAAPEAIAFALPDGVRGEAGSFVRATEDEAIAFSDGSSLELEAGSDLRFAEVDAHGARIDLQRGRVRLDVVHRDEDTSWAVRAGPFQVHVVGTRFTVEWEPRAAAFVLHMEEGRVTLEGPTLGRRAVGAGETVSVALGERRPSVADLDLSAEDAVVEGRGELGARGPEGDARSESPRARGRSADLDWRQLARQGRHREAMDAAHWDRILATGSAAELILLGDAARFAGESERAAAAYQAIRVRHAQDPRAAQAAFFLGRLALAEGDPQGAASFFGAAATEAPSGPFAALAEGRRVEALEAAGEGGAARRAAEYYLRRWPEGAHAPLAQRVLAREGRSAGSGNERDWPREGAANVR